MVGWTAVAVVANEPEVTTRLMGGRGSGNVPDTPMLKERVLLP